MSSELEGKPVRILMLNRSALEQFIQNSFLTLTRPHISVLEVLAIENLRLAPQQGILTMTNVQNVEAGVCQRSCPPISCGVSDFRGAGFVFWVQPDGSCGLPVSGFS